MIAENQKVGFCLMDTAVIDLALAGGDELMNIANPDGWIAELSLQNHSASRTIEIRGGAVRVVGS